MECNLILLAGGRSNRMHHPKGLLEYQGEPWIIHQIRSFKKVGIKLVILVLGHNWENYTSQLIGLLECKDNAKCFRGISLSLVVNSRPEKGSFSSLQCGMRRSLSQNRNAVYVKPIDVPPPEKNVWLNLAASLNSHRSIVIPSYQLKGGHPVILAPEFMESLLEIPIDHEQARLDKQIKNLNDEEKYYLDVEDPTTVLNINTPSQWELFKSTKN
ncbi:MAG: NTP transferase domain-containing protein [Proteobacteria bacterium]|nr:NTP transferase domain-containing protein [Pseudomonadota bacterium]